MEDGNIVEILCAVNSSDILSVLLSTSVFRGSGFFTIVDKDGIVVAPATGKYSVFETGEDFLAGFQSTEEVSTKFQELLQKNSSGILEMDFRKEEYHIMLEPLEYGGWTLVSATPSSSITEYFKQTAVGTTLIVAASALIFIFLMWFQRSVMIQNQIELEYTAYTDKLTGMRNYTKFLVDAPNILESNPGINFAVWSIDIRQFKNINDIFGHQAGDHVLQNFAEIITEKQTDTSIFCHISADDFAGITSYETKDELVSDFRNLVEAVEARQLLPKDQIEIDLTAGIYCINDFAKQYPVKDMVNRGVIAKRIAKDAGKSDCAFFSEEMSQVIRRENEIVAYGRQALENREICFFLQPKVDILNGNRIIGAEVLARWKHPDHGWISPGEFVPIFEKNGMINLLDRNIYNQACEWYQQYLKKGFPPINLAVNVSRLGLLQEDFFEYYTKVREQYELSEMPLELEFTESIIVNDYNRFLNAVIKLQEYGFACSIDDFGAGYSSLNVLKNLPIDVLKLDAMFFREADSAEKEEIILEGLLSMVKELGVKTVAEGVEEKEQVEFLRKNGCNIVQGYVFSRPIPPEEFMQLMEQTGGILEL